MKEMVFGSPTRWYVLAMLVFILDQSSKWLVGYYFEYGEIHPVMPFFNLTLAYNEGAAFSFLSDAGGWQRWFLSALAAIVCVAIAIWIRRLREDQMMLPMSLALVLGGALGNLTDRVVFGYVVDFIDWYYQDYHWPTFNIADSAICVGAVLLLVDSFRNSSASEKVDIRSENGQ